MKWSLPFYMGLYLLMTWAAVAWKSGRTVGQRLWMMVAGLALPLALLLALPVLFHEELREHPWAARGAVLLALAGLLAAGRLLQTSQAPWGRRLFPLAYLLAAVGCAVFISSFYYFEQVSTLVHYLESQYFNRDRPNLNLPGLSTWSSHEGATALTVFLADTVNVPLSHAFYRYPFVLWGLGLAWCLKDRDCRRRSALYLWMTPATLLGLGLFSSSESHYFLVPLFFSTLPACAGLVSLVQRLPPRAASTATRGLALLLLVLATLNVAGFRYPDSCSVIRGSPVRRFVQNVFRHDLYTNWEDLHGNPRAFLAQIFERPPLDRSRDFWALAPPVEDFLEGELFGDPALQVSQEPRILLLFGCDSLVDVLEVYYVTAAQRGRTASIEEISSGQAAALATADHDFLVTCTDSASQAREWTDLLQRDARYRLRVRKPAGGDQEFWVALYCRRRAPGPAGTQACRPARSRRRGGSGGPPPG